MKLKLNIFCVLILILCMSCVPKNRNTFNMLSTSRFYYDMSMREVATQYKLGHVTEAQKTLIINTGNQYIMDYQSAVSILSNNDCSDELRFEIMDAFIKSQIKFNKIVNGVLND